MNQHLCNHTEAQQLETYSNYFTIGLRPQASGFHLSKKFCDTGTLFLNYKLISGNNISDLYDNLGMLA